MINLHLDTDIRTLPPEEAREKIDGINQVAEHFCRTKLYEECKYCSENALEMANLINYSKGIARAKFVLGLMYTRQENYSSAIPLLSEAEKIADETNDLHLTAQVCQQIGICYWNIGDYTNEIEAFFKSVDAYNRTNQLKGEADALNSIGNCYLLAKEFDSALEYYKLAIKIKKDIRDVNGIIYSLYNIALTNNNIAAEREFLVDNLDEQEITQKYYNKALKYYFAALEFNSELERDPFLEHRILQNIGLSYINVERADEAIEIFHKCIGYYESTGNNIDKCDTLINLSLALLALGKDEEAVEWLREANVISEKLGLKRLVMQIHFHFAKYYLKKKNYKTALEYQRKYAELDLERIKTLIEDKIRKLNILHKVDITKKETEILSRKNSHLKSLNDELVKLNSEKNYFLNVAGKDLRLPLEKIGNKLEIIKRVDTNSRIQNLTDILEDTSQMQGIISNLLAINESESVK
ncbi:MAG: tetratricopeptide repeat protein [Bacteroidetes bacterium]|nr:tetratricopeptide repeat protein [Bacteroidota bacterium]